MKGEIAPLDGSHTNEAPPPEPSELAQIADRALRHAMLAQEELCGAPHNSGDYLPVRDGQALRGADLDAWVDEAENKHALQMVGRGVAYLLKQQELPGNAFSGWLKDRGVPRSTAYDCIAVAKMYARLDAAVVRRVGQLPARKQVPLASLPPGLIERLSDEGDLDALGAQPLDQLKKSLSSLRNLERRADRLEEMIHTQNAKLSRYTEHDAGGRAPPSVEAARVEGTACGLAGQRAVARLVELAGLLAGAVDLPADSNQRRALLREGLAPVHAALGMIRAAAHAALADLDDTLGHYLPAADAIDLLTPEEIRGATEIFDRQFAAVHLLRSDKEPAAKQGRGRRKRGR